MHTRGTGRNRFHRNAAKCSTLPLLLVAVLVVFPAAHAAETGASRAGYDLHPALEMKLFAAEPDIVDPVGMTFDEQGNIYVVEMRDYPLGIGPEHKPGSTVRLLRDENGDGRADNSVVFARDLSFVTSVAPWNGGVIVTAPPEIIFLKDTDGDGQADRREVLFRGFELGVTDSNVNGLRWGLDNRLHGANGGNGGAIRSPRRPDVVIPLRRMDFSFDPATGDFKPTCESSGGFGLVFDDWGRSFVTYNIDHIQQRIIPARYLERFPGFPPTAVTASISDHGEMARIFPISPPETRVNHPEQAGHFSAAGGLGYIGSPFFPGDLRGSILVCDAVGNLVHRDLLREDGPILAAARAPGDEKREFFASRDNAFRPVGLELGPDGALYLLDMQRDVIEHPDYIPEKVKEKLHLRAGEDRGRIYRITPKGGLPSQSPRLREAPVRQWVAWLSHSNQWWRMTAQRLLVERQDQTVVPELKALARQGGEPLGRLHALRTLQGLRALDEGLVRSTLADQNPNLREQGLLLAEGFLAKSRDLQERVVSLANDPSSRVRFQAALSIGECDHPGTAAALLAILRQDCEQRWTVLAVLSSIRAGAENPLRSLVEDVGFRRVPTPGKIELIKELAGLVAARGGGGNEIEVSLLALAQAGIEEPWRTAALEGFLEGLGRSARRSSASSAAAASLERMSTYASPVLIASAWKLSRALGLAETELQRRALAEAMDKTGDISLPMDARVAAIRLLALGRFSAVKRVLFPLLQGTELAEIQRAALEVMKEGNDPEIAKELLKRWRELTPAARPAGLALLLQRRAYHVFLLEALETGRIRLGELNLDLEQRRRLLRDSSAETKAKAAKLFGDEEYSNRKSLATEWLGRLPAAGDARRGRAVFEKVCASCHALDGVGFAVGPDLSAARHRSVEDVLSNILDPNMAINPNYFAYNVETLEGELETGLLQSESAEAVTLLQAQGRKLVVARRKIKRLESSGLSLMPEGLEAGLDPADVRGLIAFLQEPR